MILDQKTLVILLILNKNSCGTLNNLILELKLAKEEKSKLLKNPAKRGYYL